MNNLINIHGISTNNLKDIDVFLKKNTINIIIGPSGSGKSSLAYDTIAQIGQYEFSSMFSDIPLEPSFKVRSYSGMIAAVPIKQTNNNNNIRSTIGTYFNINSNIAILYSTILKIPYDFFILNKEANLCPKCHGLGYLKELDINRVIDYNIPLDRCPVKCWTRYKDFYINIIKAFCKDAGIDTTKKIKELTAQEKENILYGVSKEKYSIRFKKNNSFSRRTTRYFGVLTNTPMIPKFIPANSFYSDVICPDCHGQKYSPEHDKFKLNGFSIGELMCIPFSRISTWLESLGCIAKDSSLKFPAQRIFSFIKKANDLNLGHLYLNRTIPSLSGGELQRIRLVQVFNTQLTDLLIVLDEPLAGLSADEKTIICNNVKELSKRHTLLLIDHHNLFYKDASTIITLGQGSGIYGGKIVSTKEYIESQSSDFKIPPLKEQRTVKIAIQNKVYEYSGMTIEIAENRLNLITGRSGIGKSTLLREYLPQYFEKYNYINQKPLVGNANSNVATALNVFNPIISHFAVKYKKEKYFFSNQTGSDGACPSCGGSGKIIYGNDYQDKIQMVCQECDGTGFNKKLKGFTWHGNTMFEIWKMTIDEAHNFFEVVDQRISNILLESKEIMLGHLLIGQPTSTLSGGENIRIKILKSLKATSTVYGVDEPFKGLNNSEIYSIVLFFNKFLENKKTVIVADHEEESFKYFTRHLILYNDNGRLVGKLNQT